ncbi:MAG TPA: 4-hydroxy-tetrahydrodipicolinate reductase [Steroidobacteraceae bacterium]|nr:4-hydroxy-tetrahydrodipicolinate reductase [Steroidobacteraceae bacterium]
MVSQTLGSQPPASQPPASPPLVIFGITGRMGQSLVAALREGSAFHLQGAVASADSVRLGEDAAAAGRATGVKITADCAAALKGSAVAVDFSVGSAVAAHARACSEAGVPLLVGATAFDTAATAELTRAARSIAVLIAPNTSVGVATLSQLVAQAARALGETYDVEISEAHHREKRDAPSGTALSLGEVVAKSRGQTLNEVAVFDRHGADAARKPHGIGFSVVRAGDIVGEHTVTFAAAGERLELTHRTTDRVIFARGALRAAAWLIGRPAGLYGMKDVLGV